MSATKNHGRARFRMGGVHVVLATLAAACAPGLPPELEEAVVLAGGGASNPTAALAPGGEVVYVAWVETDDAGSNVVLTRIEGGAVASVPVRVNDVHGDAAAHLQAPPRVAAGSDAKVYVAWQNNTHIPGRMYPASDLRFARSTDGGRTFEAAFTVNEDAEGPPASHTFHDLTVTPGGDVVIAWLDGRRSAHAEHAGAHGSAADAEVEDAGPDVRVAISRDGGRTFQQSRIADVNACPCCRTDLAAAPDGSLYVAWRKVFEGDVRDVVVARSTDGGSSWDEPVRVHEDGWVFPGCPHAGPSLAVDADGVVHVAWYTGKEGASGLFHARSEDGGRNFSPPDVLVRGDAVPPSQVDLAVGTDGRLWAAWESRGAGGQKVLLAADRPGAAPAGEVPGSNPSLVVGTGSPLVAWLRGDSVLVTRVRP